MAIRSGRFFGKLGIQILVIWIKKIRPRIRLYLGLYDEMTSFRVVVVLWEKKEGKTTAAAPHLSYLLSVGRTTAVCSQSLLMGIRFKLSIQILSHLDKNDLPVSRELYDETSFHFRMCRGRGEAQTEAQTRGAKTAFRPTSPGKPSQNRVSSTHSPNLKGLSI